MKTAFSLFVCFLLTSCGYHLVGQGTSTVLPSGITTATLVQNSDKYGKPLLTELTHLWQQKTHMPALSGEREGVDHVTVRIEQPTNQFTPVGFDASGLAIQYRLQVSAVLKVYQEGSMIWQSGVVLVHADVFESSEPSVIEAERERLTEQLEKQWAKDAMSRLTSGF